MRLSFLILSLAIPATAMAATRAPSIKPPGKCLADRMIFADDKTPRAGKAEPRKLGELPPGRLYLSVDRQVDGCRQPVIVRYGIGAATRGR
jgi:hypothetical protein